MLVIFFFVKFETTVKWNIGMNPYSSAYTVISKDFILATVLWIRKIFFADSESEFFCKIRIRILRLIFWHNNFLNSGTHCFHVYSGTCQTEKKFCYRKHITVHFVLFQAFNLYFSELLLFLFYSSIYCRPESVSEPNFFSDPDLYSAKTFRFFRIRIHNTDYQYDSYIFSISLYIRNLQAY
jgi:hypothetical protein